MTGWLVEWPASTVLNVVYALLVEHANADQIEEIDKKLDRDITSGGPDALAAALQRALIDDE